MKPLRKADQHSTAEGVSSTGRIDKLDRHRGHLNPLTGAGGMSHNTIGAALDCDESDIRCQLSQTAQGFDWLGIRKDGKRFLTTRQEQVDASQKLDNFFKMHIDHITLILVDRNRSGSPRAKLPDHTHTDIC